MTHFLITNIYFMTDLKYGKMGVREYSEGSQEENGKT